MSVLFPKVNKPREWDYRPIYYDPKKDEREQRRQRLNLRKAQENAENNADTDEHLTSLHRGSFREARQYDVNTKHQRVSKLTFWIVLLCMLLFVFYFLL